MKPIALIFISLLLPAALWAANPQPCHPQKNHGLSGSIQKHPHAPALIRNESTAMHIVGAYSLPTIASVPAVVFVMMTNTAKVEDELLGAQSKIAKAVEIHESKQQGEVLRMLPVKSIKIPAGGKLAFRHGGYHLMLIGLKKNLKKGDQIQVTFEFKKAGKVTLKVPVLKMGPHAGMHGMGH